MIHEQFLKDEQVTEMLGVSKSTLLRLEKTDKDLRPVYPSVGTKRYVASKVFAFMERVANRGY